MNDEKQEDANDDIHVYNEEDQLVLNKKILQEEYHQVKNEDNSAKDNNS